MNYLGTDYLIVYAFLFITLFIGLRAGRGIKDLRDYALANKTYSTFAIVLTYLATNIGGGTILGGTKEVFTNGIIATAAMMGMSVSFVLRAIFIAPRMHRFKDCLTLGDVMGSLYGPSSKVITGSLGLVFSLGVLGIQLNALGLLCEALLGVKASWGVGVGGLILAIYTASGGIKSVTATDIFQFLALFAVIPLTATIAVGKAGGFVSIVEQVPAARFSIWNQPNFSIYLTFFLVHGLFSVDMTNPAGMQRILMVRDGRQLGNVFFNVAVFDASFRVITMLLALAGLALYPHIAPNTVVTHVVQELLPIGIRGLAIAGILAVIMSTADSFLHAAGLTLAHDIVQPFSQRNGNTINELQWAKYATLLIGGIAMGVGLYQSNLFALSLQASGFIGPILAVPLIAGIIGLKPSQRLFYTAALVTIVAFLSARFLLPIAQQQLAILIAFFTNAVVFLGMHLIVNQGFNLTQRSTETRLESRQSKYSRPRSLLAWSQQKIDQYGAPYMLFGLFCCVNFTMPYFMWVSKTPNDYDIVPYLRLLGAMMGCLLVVKDKWPRTLLPYFPLFWHFTLLYCIPFSSTLMFLLTQGSIEWLINVAITIMFLIVLVDWATFLWITAFGVSLSLLSYSAVIGPITLQLSFSSSYLLIYQVVFATLIGLLFARRKEQRITKERYFMRGQGEVQQANLLKSAVENRKVLKALQNTGVGNLLTMIKSLHELDVKKTDRIKLEALERELIPMAFQLQGIDTRSQDYLRLHIKEEYHIEELLNAVKNSLQKSGIETTIKIANEVQYQNITGDFEQLVTLLTKSISSLQKLMEEDQVILMSLKDTQLSYPLPDVAKSYIKHVPALRIAISAGGKLPVQVPSYSPELNGSTSHTSSETTQGIDRMANARIIKAHYGYSEVSEDTLLYVVPIDVREVRPRDMDKAYMEVDATPQRANDHFKSTTVDAQAQEAMFLTDVAAGSDADLGLIKMALELIKWYHGPSERKSGEPFYLHPLTVAHIVLSYDQDEATIIGALLHDTVEDTPMLLQHIETVFGKETAEVVDLVTHLQSIEGSIYKVKMSASENLQMLERTGNKRGLYVKIADRMHNMRTINGHPKVSKRKLVAQETADFFVPLARKLGLEEAAAEFEKMCEEVFEQKG